LILVDTNVLLDVLQVDPVWADWSQQQLDAASLVDLLAVNPVIYAELSVGFRTIEELESTLSEFRLAYEDLPRESLFLAGKVYAKYRRSAGRKTGVLADFFIGAHAAIKGYPLLTRDGRTYREYFPNLRLVAPSAQ
jgi:predicted nucleic acid-binding protein